VKRIVLFILLISTFISYAQNIPGYTRTEVQVKDTTYEVRAEGKMKVGLISNVWHPAGLIVNYQAFDDFLGLGFYATAKSNFEMTQKPVMNQYNFTGGISFDLFQKTIDMLIGASYVTKPDNMSYYNPHYDWGIEVLAMTQFSDRNWRMIFGWHSNPTNWKYGLTAGFAFQF